MAQSQQHSAKKCVLHRGTECVLHSITECLLHCETVYVLYSFTMWCYIAWQSARCMASHSVYNPA